MKMVLMEKIVVVVVDGLLSKCRMMVVVVDEKKGSGRWDGGIFVRAVALGE